LIYVFRYQRQGAGSLLLQWGMKASAQNDVPIYLESTLEAANFHQKHKFKEVTSFCVEAWSEEKQKRQKYTEVGLVYPSRASACVSS